jgi:tetratricopeptide (TPR) repeat protein
MDILFPAMDAMNGARYEMPAVMKFIWLPILSTAVVASFAAHPSLDSARRALSERIPEVALAELKIAMALPDFPESERRAALVLSAEAQLLSGKSADALVSLSGLAGRDVTLLRAHALGAEGRWEEALTHYIELEDVEAAPLSARLGHAEALQILGRTPEAVTVLEKLIASGKATPSVRLRHAGLIIELGRKNEAEQLSSEIVPVALVEKKWLSYVQARLLLAREQWQAALDALEAVVEKPEGVTPNLHAAVLLAATEARLKLPGVGPDVAVRELEKFLTQNVETPAMEMIFRRLDQINQQERSPRESEFHRMALDRDEAPNRRRAALAQFYVCRMQMRERSRRQLAETSFQNFLAWFPNHRLTTFIHEMQADLEQSRGNFSAAGTALEAARTNQDRERGAHLAMRLGLNSYLNSDAARAVTYFQLASEQSPKLRKSASFNAALAELARRNMDGFKARFADFASNYSSDPLNGELALESGLLLARDNAENAPSVLRAFLTSHPAHERAGEARLALGEIALLAGNVSQAESAIATAKAVEKSDATGGQAERNDYAAIFAADAAALRDDGGVERVVTLARNFIQTHAQSSLLGDVRMKLGQTYFHQEDFANAQTQFETIAQEQPESELAETALFLAGQCAAKLMTPTSAERAKKLFDQVVERKGPLKHYARFQQGLIEHQLDNDASAIFQSILEAQPPAAAEIRYATLCAKGDNLVRLAKGAPEKLGAALAAFTQLAAIPEASSEWHNRAVYKQGKVLVQLGREQEALVIFNRLLDSAGVKPTETFWLYKAGFEAASMLEGMGSWESALAIYGKLANIPGTRAAEAKEKVKKLQLSRFIWEQK